MNNELTNKMVKKIEKMGVLIDIFNGFLTCKLGETGEELDEAFFKTFDFLDVLGGMCKDCLEEIKNAFAASKIEVTKA